MRRATSPWGQFERWYRAAAASGMRLPEAVALATTGRRGAPSVRMVLLRGWSRRGFCFFTNYESRKGLELAGNARGALLFYWRDLERQIRIEGSIRRLSRRASVAYFRSRPRESQLSAWASPQSQVIADRMALEERFARARDRFAGKPVPCPPHWGGYRLSPTRIEFWQGREHRLHDRTCYQKHGSRWGVTTLAP